MVIHPWAHQERYVECSEGDCATSVIICTGGLQAYGAKQYKMVGTWYLRALLISLTVAFIVIVPLGLNIGHLLLWAGDHPTPPHPSLRSLILLLPAKFRARSDLS